MPRGLGAVLPLFLLSLLQHSSDPMEQALEPLYLNSQSTNTQGLQGEAVQNPPHFLMSAAPAYQIPQRERARHGPTGPDKGPYTQAETPPALGGHDADQGKAFPSPTTPDSVAHLTRQRH